MPKIFQPFSGRASSFPLNQYTADLFSSAPDTSLSIYLIISATRDQTRVKNFSIAHSLTLPDTCTKPHTQREPLAQFFKYWLPSFPKSPEHILQTAWRSPAGKQLFKNTSLLCCSHVLSFASESFVGISRILPAHCMGFSWPSISCHISWRHHVSLSMCVSDLFGKILDTSSFKYRHFSPVLFFSTMIKLFFKPSPH